MKDLILVYISVFGTVSALAITVLVFLYEVYRRGTSNNKMMLIKNLTQLCNCPDCNHAFSKNIPFISLIQETKSNCNNNAIDKRGVLEIIELLGKVSELGEPNEETIKHINECHKDDIDQSHAEYYKSKKMLEDYPNDLKRAVAYPLILSFILSMIYWGKDLLNRISPPFLSDIIILILIAIGYYYIYSLIIGAVNNLKYFREEI
jgi:hypothetical protein